MSKATEYRSTDNGPQKVESSPGGFLSDAKVTKEDVHGTVGTGRSTNVPEADFKASKDLASKSGGK